MHSSRELRSSSFRIALEGRRVELHELFQGFGDHGRLDVWPRRKEAVVPPEPDGILETINDRAITRLVVEDGAPGDHAYAAEELASARGRILTCLAYSASGSVVDADVRIAGNAVTEGYVADVLDPERRLARLRAAGNEDGSLGRSIAARGDEVTPEEGRRIRREREALIEDGVPVESYRRIGLEDALGLLGARSRRLHPELMRAG